MEYKKNSIKINNRIASASTKFTLSNNTKRHQKFLGNKESDLYMTSLHSFDGEEKRNGEANYFKNSLIKETSFHNTRSAQMQTSFRSFKSKAFDSINLQDKTLKLASGVKNNLRNWKGVVEKGRKFDSGNFTLPLFSEIIKH